MVTRLFGGDGAPTGDPESDPAGTVRRSPNNHMIAIKWTDEMRRKPDPYVWEIMDTQGIPFMPRQSRGVAHWPVIGTVPGSPGSPHPITPRLVDVDLPDDLIDSPEKNP